MLFINKLFNSIACLLSFTNLQLVIPGRTWILLYLGRTVYKRLWACLALYYGTYFYCPQRSFGKVIFSEASVILSTGRGVSQTPPPGGHPPGRRLLLRMVRILLECIPVSLKFLFDRRKMTIQSSESQRYASSES